MKHRALALALVTILAGSALPGCPTSHGSSAAGVRSIRGAEAHQLVAAGATLVDVRTSGEFADGHAQGARNIPVDELESRLGEVPRGHVVVVYCASGARSARAAGVLARAGYDVRDLGTLDAWEQR